MPKSRENRRRRLKRRRKHERRLAARITIRWRCDCGCWCADRECRNCGTPCSGSDQPYEEDSGWLCNCGNWIDDSYHCPLCGAEPPWGCPCGGCEERDNDYDGYDPDDSCLEPCGSCEWCGANIYPSDYGSVDGLREQCAWSAEQNNGGDTAGFQPVV